MKLRARGWLGAAVSGAALILAAPALAQQGSGSVEIAPTNSRPDDPNGGKWFFVRLGPSQTRTISATIRNTSGVAQTVRVYLKELDFSAGGAPEIRRGSPAGIGTWGEADPSQLQIQPRSAVQVRIRLTAPAAATPGDHIGAVVTESERRQVGVRLYVNVPGPARRAFEIERRPRDLRWRFWPTTETIPIVVRNTGTTTLPLDVTIAGRGADGPRMLVSRHREMYEARLHVPWYGGPVHLPVEMVERDLGAVHRASASIFVLPWGLLASFVGGVFLPWVGVRNFRRRPSMIADLHAETARAENKLDLATIEQSLRRARRAGSRAVLERLALALHGSGNDALDLLLEALERPREPRRSELIRAAASYGKVALLANRGTAKLPPDVASELIDAAQMRRKTRVN